MPSLRLVRLGHCPQLRRSLFTLPDLSSLSPFSAGGKDDEPQRYHERKILPYSQRELYDVVSDVKSYPRFLPFCSSTRILKHSPALQSNPSYPPIETMEAEMTVGFSPFKETYVSEVTCKLYESVEVVASSSTPLFKTLNTAWRFQPASAQSPHPSKETLLSSDSPEPPGAQIGAAPTLVTLDLTFAFANPVHAAMSAAFFSQVSKLMVDAFERRCVELYGDGKR